jgi:hypothetical protein
MAVGDAIKKKCSELACSDWWLSATAGVGEVTLLSPDRIQVVLLWEVLQELKRLNTLLSCINFTTMPRDIRAIKRELAALRKITEAKK